MSEKLVTQDLLKAFGDKSKKIFRPTIVTNSEGFKYLKVETIVPSISEWSFNIELWTKGDIIEGSYSGDLKATITANNNPLTGYGAIYYGNFLKGLSFIIDSDYVTLLFEFEENSVVESLVDILNYKDNNGCNIVNRAEFIQTLDDYQNSITTYNTIGVVNEIIGIMGTLNSLNFKPTDSLFQIRIPSKTSEEDTKGVLLRIPGLQYTIDKVNNSKWSDYLLPNYKVIFKEGDLESFYVTFGGDTKTERVLEGPKINNQIKYYEGYKEGDFVGRVKVNSNGLVTEVEKDPELPMATETTLGVIQVGYNANLIDKQYPVKLDDDGNAYVHVPWNDTDTWDKVADSDNLGLIKIGYEQSGKNYPVELDSNNKAYVNVPWTDTHCEAATETQLGSIKVGYTTTDKNYAVQLDSNNNAYVNIPWEDTTYNLATHDTAGLIKIGGEETDCKKPVILDNGVAYVSVKPSQSIMIFSATSNSDYSGPIMDYTQSQFFTINIGDTFEKPAATLGIQESSAPKEGIKTTVVRIINNKTTSVPFKIFRYGNIKITNMFDASILSSGLDIPAGKTLELVFTFWDVNEVSFNGGLSV